MTRRRLVISFVLMISLAVLILISLLPQILARVAMTKLEALGATAIDLKLAEVSLTKSRIEKLHFLLSQKTRRYTVDARDIKLSYNLPALLTGNLDSVVVPELSVFVKVLADSDTNKSRNIPLPAVWLESLPFRNLDINDLQFEFTDINNITQHIEIDGRLEHGISLTRLRLNIHSNKYGAHRLELNMMPNGVSDMVLSYMQTPTTAVQYMALSSSKWVSTDRQLQTELGIDIDVAALQQLLVQSGIDTLPKGIRGQLKLKGLMQLPFNGSPLWQPSGRVSLQLPKLKNMAKDLVLNAPLAVTLDQQQVQWRFDTGAQLSLRKINISGIGIKSLKAKLLSAFACQYKLTKSHWSCQASRLALAIPSINRAKNSITTSAGKLEFKSASGNLTSWSARLHTDMPNWVINITRENTVKQITFERVLGDIDASNQTVHAKLAFVAAGGGATLHVNASHELKNKAGQLQYWLAPVDLRQHGAVFATIYSDWPTGLVLNDGMMDVSGKLFWSKNKLSRTPQATITMKNVSGAYDEIGFTKLTTTLDVRGLLEPQIKSRQEIRLAMLDAGTPLTDISLQAEMLMRGNRKPELIISDLTMKTLGGKLSGKQIELDFARKQNPFTLQVSGLNVEELFKLEQKQDVLGTGIIDGELPLMLTADGIIMQNAQLTARKPGGKLQYRANQGMRNMAQSNAGMQLLVIALKDFTYKVLEVVANYTPDGLLKLNVRIEGSNPELEGGRPVHLNVDVEDNILELLRSLRLADEIGDKIGEQVQQRGQHKQ